MTKKEIAEAVKKVAAVTAPQAGKAVNTTLQAISNALERGEEVQLIGFGTFKVTDIPERKGRNPRTGEELTIAAHKAVKFTAGKQLKEKINK